MREILFRGKDYKGNWLYGSLVKKTFLQPNWDNLSEPKDITNYLIVSKPKFSWTDEYDTTEVIEKTIGQYTGLTDKNGKKIFEGDIFKGITEDTNQTRYAVIKFGKYKDVNFEDSCYGFYFEYGGEQFSLFNGEAEGFNLLEMVEIVGNIYDNPELVEKVVEE